jgi:hypothetical protein
MSSATSRRRLSGALAFSTAALVMLPLAADAQGQRPRGHQGPTTIVRQLPNTTQGPPWPPSELANADGDFVVVGSILTEVAPGVIVPIPTRGALVSKNTVPPLGPDGREDFTNLLGAPYTVIRPLDLRRGSPDLDMELFALSYGPPEGDFGGRSRVPKEGDSPFNLNALGTTCADLFPTEAQRFTFTRDAFPLSEVPVASFRGDGVQYDVDSGLPFDPRLRSGSDCFPDGCSGEDPTSFRDTTPITLGRWLSARGKVRIQLRDFDRGERFFTRAKFDYTLNNLIPHGVYTFWAIRQNNFFGALPDPLALPNVRVADHRGRIRASFLVDNPFPDPETDTLGNRIIVLAVAYHPDFQNWGACFSKLGPGVDAMAVFSTIADGTDDVTDFITVPPRP